MLLEKVKVRECSVQTEYWDSIQITTRLLVKKVISTKFHWNRVQPKDIRKSYFHPNVSRIKDVKPNVIVRKLVSTKWY